MVCNFHCNLMRFIAAFIMRRSLVSLWTHRLQIPGVRVVTAAAERSLNESVNPQGRISEVN